MRRKPSSLAPAASPERQNESGPFVIAKPLMRRAIETTVADEVATTLALLGVEHGFGLVGGTIAAFCEALARTSVRIVHCRHETGAAFAAIEAHFLSDKPSVVF